MEVSEEHQKNPVADPVEALVAVTRPILAAVLASVSKETLELAGKERLDVPLALLSKLRSESDGETGVAFEYAVHSAVLDRNSVVLDRIESALKKCNIKPDDPQSILFAIEKQGSQQLLSTQVELITDASQVLSGQAGRPVKLKNQLNVLAAAFRRNKTGPNLPQSISGLWKADLFLGDPTPDKWIGTTVKVNRKHLEGARGLRVAIVPAEADRSDAIYKDEGKNLVVCPMPFDMSFMQTFYEGRRVVQALLASNFNMPKEGVLTRSQEREVARMYVERRTLAVVDVIDIMKTFQQPHLLEPRKESIVTTAFASDAPPAASSLLAPFPSLPPA